jgi:hypothetical protein
LSRAEKNNQSNFAAHLTEQQNEKEQNNLLDRHSNDQLCYGIQHL